MRLEWVFLMQFFIGILMIVFLQKLNEMKKQIDDITKEVMNYISYVTEDLEGEISVDRGSENNSKRTTEIKKKNAKIEKEDAQNQLIQAILGEYFP